MKTFCQSKVRSFLVINIPQYLEGWDLDFVSFYDFRHKDLYNSLITKVDKREYMKESEAKLRAFLPLVTIRTKSGS